MSDRQAGWRTARPVVAPRTAASMPGRAAFSPAAGPSRGQQTGAIRRVGARAMAAVNSPVGRWSIGFVGVLGYIYAAVTFRLPIATASMIVALIGLAFERNRIVIPPFLVVFALYITWSFVGWS